MASPSGPADSSGRARDGHDRGGQQDIARHNYDVEVAELRAVAIFRSLCELRRSDKFADMTIRCGGRDFKAHRAVVCSQSPFFDRALSGGFLVSNSIVV